MASKATTTNRKPRTQKRSREKKEKRPGPGRPSKFDVELGKRIVARIEDSGVSPDVAAAECGISPSTIRRWRIDGRLKSSKELAQFEDEVARACAVSVGFLHRRALEGDLPGQSFGQARAALEILSRTNRRYSPKIQLGVEDEMRKLLECARRVLKDEDFDKLLEEIDRVTAEEDERDGAA